MTIAIATGTRLGPYEILAPAGAGGMGEVYRARDSRLGREVAVKVLSAGSGDDESFRRRFAREARLISSISHPHICSLFDIGSDGGRDFLVMELLEGQTLATLLDAGPLPEAAALDYAIQIASALEAAHRKGIVRTS